MQRRAPTSLVVTPAVVAHRGASGYRPEHTVAAYATAIRMGVDDIEVDVVPTRDGVLIARHENELSRSTDIAGRPELAHLRTTRVVDGVELTGWFTEDLTLAQVRTLTAREPLPGLRAHNTAHDGAEPIATLDDVFRMTRSEATRRSRGVGVMVELKSPSHFARSGLAVEELLLAALARHRLDHPRSRVSVMSFETAVLRRLGARARVPVIQLLDRIDSRPVDLVETGDSRTYGDLASVEGLAAIGEYADGIGPHKTLVLPRTATGSGRPTSLVRDAHRRWLTVHVWTLRAENRYLPVDLRHGADPAGFGDLATEARLLLDSGVDGLIADHPDIVALARRSWLAEADPAGVPQASGIRIHATR